MPFEWNTASFRVLEKAGYVREARMRRSALKDDQRIDQMLYAYVVEGEVVRRLRATAGPTGPGIGD